MAKGPFKMKGSPMQRNFGISPLKVPATWKQKIKAGLLTVQERLASADETKKKQGSLWSHYKKSKKSQKKFDTEQKRKAYEKTDEYKRKQEEKKLEDYSKFHGH